MHWLSRSLGIVLLLVIGWSFFAHAQFLELDPMLQWQMIETKHFRVVYHPGLEKMAQETAKVCEDAYTYWVEELKYTPDFKTNIILADTADFAVGAANPFGPDIIGGTSWARTPNEWINSANPSMLDDVMYHEYGHVVDLRKVHGIPALLRALFGAIVIPNAAKPHWFVEGIPISAELRRTGASRANATRDAMYFRTHFINNWKNFPTLDQMASDYSRTQWPSTYMLHHDYGAWIVRFIAETYGVDKIELVDKFIGSNLITTLSLGLMFDFAGVMHKALGVSVDQFNAAFKSWIQEAFTAQIDQIRAEGVTASQRISAHSYWNNEPAWSPDGKMIAYYHFDPQRVAGVRLMQADEKKDHVVTSIPLELPFFRPPFWAATPAWSPDGTQLVYSRMKTYRHRYIYGDIYLYDLKHQRETQLTKEARAFNPVFTPDGKSIVFGQQQWGEKTPRLAIYSLETKEISVLHEFAENELLDSLAVSPDGKQIAFSLWKVGGYQDLYTMPIQGGEPTALTQDQFGDFDPAYSPDGKFILFSSNRDGVDNLYAYRLADNTLHKVTNMLTGAFAPDVSPDSKQIVFVSYSLDGYEIHTMGYDAAAWKQVAFTKDVPPTWAGYAKDLFKSQRYNSLKLLWPQWIFPIMDPTAPGILAIGGDPLRMHSYVLSLGITLGEKFDKRLPYFFVNYTNHQFFPIFDLSISQDEKAMRQGIQITLPLLNQLTETQSLSLGYQRQQQFDLKMSTVQHTISASASRSAFGGSDLFQIESERDSHTEISWKETDPFTLNRWSAVESGRVRMRLPVEHDQYLALRYAAGTGNIKDRFKIGGHTGPFPLRGWESDSLQGQYGFAGSLSYNALLWSIERGLGLWPYFIDDLSGTVFADVGAAVDKVDQLSLNSTKIGYGIELRLRLSISLGIPIQVWVGIAQGLGRNDVKYYWDVGFGFQ